MYSGHAMLNRFKSTVSKVMGGIHSLTYYKTDDEGYEYILPDKLGYDRPHFLELSEDEIQVSADHQVRPVLVPREVGNLPCHAGYSEVINAGKSKQNEDQASCGVMRINPHTKTKNSKGTVQRISTEKKVTELQQMAKADNEVEDGLSFTYYGIYDGHAGTGAALVAAKFLQHHVRDKIKDIEDLIHKNHTKDKDIVTKANTFTLSEKDVSCDSLIIGALEDAFCEMDAQIAREKRDYNISGGCTALFAMFFLGKLYIANAGDCRAVLCKFNKKLKAIPLSEDFTPSRERKRLQYLAQLQPQLLHNDFCPYQFRRRINRKDLGKKMLFRDALMEGWRLKKITEDDLKCPLIHGEGKRVRLLATIGVTRGFGDHDLRVFDSDIYVKPFLSPVPEVKVYDLMNSTVNENDVLIMGSDGLWDVVTNECACHIVHTALMQYSINDRHRYKGAAQELVAHVRGMEKNCTWKMADGKQSSCDDITAFVIPLHYYTSNNVHRESINSINGSGDVSHEKNIVGKVEGESDRTLH